MEKKIIDRITYQKIKKMTYDQMQQFLVDIYIQGHENATKELASNIQETDAEGLEKEIREWIRVSFGIGATRYHAKNMEEKIKGAIKKHTNQLEIIEVSTNLKEMEGQ